MAHPEARCTCSSRAQAVRGTARQSARATDSCEEEDASHQSASYSAGRGRSREAAVSRYVSFRDFDWVLLVLVLLICALGVVEIYSATLSTKFAGVHLKQVYWILGGVALMFIVSVLNYQALLERVPLHVSDARLARCWRWKCSARSIWARAAGCSSAPSTFSPRNG